MKFFKKTFPVCVAFMVGLGFTAFPGPNTNLPFADDFELHASGTQLINGTNGWYGSWTNVVVQNSEKSPFGSITSTNSAKIPMVESISNLFAGIDVTNLWVTMDVRPVLYLGDEPPLIDTNASAVFYVGSNGYFFVADGGPTSWVAITNTAKGDPATQVSQDWVRLHLFKDYTHGEWDFFVNNIRMKKDIAFVSNIVATLNGFELKNGSGANAYLDNVLISTNLPVDLGQDGGDWLPELKVSTTTIEQSVLQDLNADSQTFTLWRTNGTCGINYDVSVSTNWLSVDKTSGYTDTGTELITISYSTAHLRRGTYTGVVTVAATDDDYGFNAKNPTQHIEVVLEVIYIPPSLANDPSLLTQDVQRGANATNQTFQVWNATSHYRANYAVNAIKNKPFEPWDLDCNPGIGFTTGEYDTIVVSYDTASLDEGTYRAIIEITGKDHTYGDDLGTNKIGVTINVIVPPGPPAGSIHATKGEYDDQVHIHWGTVDEAVSYEVWRGSTFDSSYAQRLSDTSATNFYDTTSEPGVKYYYWVRPKNAYGWPGGFGSYDYGYRTMVPPSGIFVSQGSYTNKVRIWWAEVDGAVSYEVWRNEVDSQASALRIKHTSGTSFEDLEVEPGRVYYYWVKAKSRSYASGFSAGASGFTLLTPSNISATDGLYVGRIAVTWTAVPGAASYEIWRHDMPLVESAVKIGDSYGASFDDITVEPDKKYYYWVRANNVTSRSGLGGWASGSAAYGYADLQVAEFVFLPRNFRAGDSPSVVSFELRNGGPEDIIPPNSEVMLSFYLSSDATLGNSDDVPMGSLSRAVGLSAGEAEPVVLTDAERKAVKIPQEVLGPYYVFVKVEYQPSSSLVDPYPETAVAYRDSNIMVGDSSASTAYHVINDYTGDGRSDIAVYDPATGAWYIRNVLGEIIVWGESWGGPGFEPVFGDYNGDGKADMAVYHQATGKWYVRGLDGTLVAWGLSWGAPGFSPCFGDYNGDGKTDFGVYHEAEGKRYIWSLSQGVLLWGVNWGAPGFVSVSGDFDGSGAFDMAVYNQATGDWYIRSVDGSLLAWGEQWGGPGILPVSGDYSGNGRDDIAVYHETTGSWYIKSLNGDVVVWGEQWGGPGYVPVQGDFNGDGIADLAVYDLNSGYWFIRSISGSVIAWGVNWGAPGFVPVGAQ